jgi:NAD(P)-dependent dehydrogenase (short-subunit alcohol dehydrogenase family)
MQLHLEGKLALVTGSTMGIGKAIAKSLLQEGAQVIINGRSQASVDAVVAEFQMLGKVFGVVGDLGTVTGCAAVIAAVQQIGDVELLINNVGKFDVTPFAESTDEAWLDHFNVNVMSGVRLTRALMPKMLERNAGRVIFMSSEAAIKPMPDLIPYSMTKTAQVSIARGLAELTKGTHITVNSVLVAPTRTEGSIAFFDAAGMSDPEAARQGYFSTMGMNSLLQRFATPEEIADFVVFLCSPNAAAINGSAQRVEGGIIRSIL